MKWSAPIPKLVDGDLKVVNKFAWLPKRIREEKIWLERYQQLWEYSTVVRKHPVPRIQGYWTKLGEKIGRGVPFYDNAPPPPMSTPQQRLEWYEFLSNKKKEWFNAG